MLVVYWLLCVVVSQESSCHYCRWIQDYEFEVWQRRSSMPDFRFSNVMPTVRGGLCIAIDPPIQVVNGLEKGEMIHVEDIERNVATCSLCFYQKEISRHSLGGTTEPQQQEETRHYHKPPKHCSNIHPPIHPFFEPNMDKCKEAVIICQNIPTRSSHRLRGQVSFARSIDRSIARSPPSRQHTHRTKE